MSETNPAAERFVLLSSWRQTPPNHSVIQHRGGEPAWWCDHLRAIALLELVTERVNHLAATRSDNSAIFLTAIKRVRAGIFATDTAMNNAVMARVTTSPSPTSARCR